MISVLQSRTNTSLWEICLLNRFVFILQIQFCGWLFIWFCNDLGTGLELHRRVETRSLAWFVKYHELHLKNRLLSAFQEFEQYYFHHTLSSLMVAAASEIMLQAHRVLLWKTQLSETNCVWMRWMSSSSPRISILTVFSPPKNPFYSPLIKSEDIINIITVYLATW